jgi:hypothetical protein
MYKEKKQFRKREREASKNISKIFNPNNKERRKNKEILDSIFGDD